MSKENLYLENRKVLKVSGLNCVDFLNNILTSDISKLKPLETIPAALLSPQGKVLYDILVSLDFKTAQKEKTYLQVLCRGHAPTVEQPGACCRRDIS